MKQELNIMGILNLTPDSFSDGGQFNQLNQAVRRAQEMEKEGADIIDIGAESSGPGSKDIPPEEERSRLIPVLREIRKFTKLPISIDTYKSQIANEALQEGANIINDVTALRGDPNMAQIVAKHQAKIVLMYSKDPTARTTKHHKEYKDVIQTINDFLKKRITKAKSAGIPSEDIIIDPGMGHFVSSIPKYSYEIIARLPELQKLGLKILIGISRKSFLGGKLADRDDRGLPLTTIAYLNGASIIRTHNVKSTKTWLSSN